MASRRIAIIEDDDVTREHLLGLVRTLDDVEVMLAANAAEAADIVALQDVTLAVIDVDLGSGPQNKYAGLGLLTKLSQRCPVIVVSGMPEENFLKGVSLTLRAWDFIAKPISEIDFLNKVKHALCFEGEPLPGSATTPTNSFPPGLSTDPHRAPGLLWKGRPVRLTLTELRLVYALIATPGKVVDAQRLAKAMDTGDVSALPTHLMGVRKKFRDVDDDFNQIRTEAGKGYAWEANR